MKDILWSIVGVIALFGIFWLIDRLADFICNSGFPEFAAYVFLIFAPIAWFIYAFVQLKADRRERGK